MAWREGDIADNERTPTKWAAYIQENQRTGVVDSDKELEGDESEEGKSDMEDVDSESLSFGM